MSPVSGGASWGVVSPDDGGASGGSVSSGSDDIASGEFLVPGGSSGVLA